jgi:hypothetical protein
VGDANPFNTLPFSLLGVYSKLSLSVLPSGDLRSKCDLPMWLVVRIWQFPADKGKRTNALLDPGITETLQWRVASLVLYGSYFPWPQGDVQMLWL